MAAPLSHQPEPRMDNRAGGNTGGFFFLKKISLENLSAICTLTKQAQARTAVLFHADKV